MKTLVILLLATLAACTTLPDPHLAPEGSETAATIDELGPGQYHVLVRINYFAADGEAERLLRERAATLCGDQAVHLDHLATARQPAMAAADVTCGDLQDEASASKAATDAPAEAPPEPQTAPEATSSATPSPPDEVVPPTPVEVPDVPGAE